MAPRNGSKEWLQGMAARNSCKEWQQGIAARNGSEERQLGMAARNGSKERKQGTAARNGSKERQQGMAARNGSSSEEDLLKWHWLLKLTTLTLAPKRAFQELIQLYKVCELLKILEEICKTIKMHKFNKMFVNNYYSCEREIPANCLTVSVSYFVILAFLQTHFYAVKGFSVRILLFG
jgi:hypothetical protein